MKTIVVTEAEKKRLKLLVQSLPDTQPLAALGDDGFLIAALGVSQEIGTPSDELSPFLADANTSFQISPRSLQSRVIEYNGHFGVEISSPISDNLLLQKPGLKNLIHPKLSIGANGRIERLVFFPESLDRIARLQSVELVVVREWALNTVFGRFNNNLSYYQTNLWEIENDDTLRFSKMLSQRKLPLLGTHDITAHNAGLTKVGFDLVETQSSKIKLILEEHRRRLKSRGTGTLLLPYLAGFLLDDLAQPKNYGSLAHVTLLEAVSSAIANNAVPLFQNGPLRNVPQSFSEIIDWVRSPLSNSNSEQGEKLLKNLTTELKMLMSFRSFA